MGDAAAGLTGPTAGTVALDRFFAAIYRRRPVSATFTGVHGHDERLPEWSPLGLAGEADELRALRRELDAAGRVPDESIVRFPDDVDLALADAYLEIAIAEHESGHFVHRNPSLWTGEAIFGVLSLVTRDFAPLAERLESARQRLEATPRFLGHVREVVKAAPLDWKGRAKRECQAGAQLLGGTLPAWVAAQYPAAEVTWRAAAQKAVRAFQELDTWLGPVGAASPLNRFRSTLDSAPPERESVGRDLLSLLLARGHFVTTPIDDLLREASDALDEATARLDEMSRPHGGWPAVQELLAADHAPADEYLSCLERKWRACKDASDAHDLVTWHDAPLRYGEIPQHTRDAAPHLYYLNYRSPAPFDPFGTFEYIVPPIAGLPPAEVEAKLRGMNHSVMMLNHVVHHGAIGHHVQNHHAYRGASRIGQVAAVDTANRIAMFSGGSLAEGWACYVCDLMEEIGFLKPLERIAQQHTRVRIAARAVVDLSIHTGRMTVPQAAWLYEDRAHMAQAAAKAESVRNSMYPGTAVMYWLGTQGIHRLRAEIAAREGAAFSRRRFHDRFLSYGAIPVALIARLMLAEGGAR